MKKIFLAVFSLLFILSGCTKNDELESSQNTFILQNTKTDEEKMLDMIQSCIKDYNEDKIKEREDYLQTIIPKLPIGIESLPEISSLEQLSEQTFDKTQTNAFYIGTYQIKDDYSMKITIYKPTTGSFWLNGAIQFQIDPSQVEKNNPNFSFYRDELNRIFSSKYNILNWLYGIDLTLGEEVEDGYFEVLQIGNTNIHSIDELKSYAEQVFTKDFLENNYYPASFTNEGSVFKEINGVLCCVQSELAAPNQIQYNPSYIVQIRENDTSTDIDILYQILDQIQPTIQRIQLNKTEHGFRLSNAY